MHLAFATPAPAETGGGGGADYVGGLVASLRHLGHRVDLLVGRAPAFPPGARPVIDGMLLPHLRPRLDELAAADAVLLVHHVAAAAGRDDGARATILAIEREMIPRLRRVVATSRSVAERLAAEFGVAAETLVAGARDLPRAAPGEGPPLILSVGVLTRRKRHDRLLHMLARLTDLAWRLVVAGDSGRDPIHAAELPALAAQLGLADRVTLLTDPAADALERAWSGAALFASATRWEGYPAAAAEALRRGIPVVMTDTGGISGLVPMEAGAIVGASGDGALDEPTFGKCLRRLLQDAPLRADITEAAWRAGQALPSWPTQAARFAALLEH